MSDQEDEVRASRVLATETEDFEQLRLLSDMLEGHESLVGVKGHSERVAHYCGQMAAIAANLGIQIGLDEDLVENIRRAGLLHDIGKVGIPTCYLAKPGPLTKRERRVMERHPVLGFEIVKGFEGLSRVRTLIRGHHEKLDGTGYPDGLIGDQISPLQRCLSIADVYDALTSPRSYRAALAPEEALTVIRNEVSLGWWDKEIVKILVKLVVNGKSNGGDAQRP